MAFPIGAVIGAVAGIGSSILGGSSQASSARAQNKAAQAQAERQYKRSLKEWEIEHAARLAQWNWDAARVEQLRYNEKQAAADYNVYNSRLINAAVQNLKINSVALYDKYVTEEGLRAQQVGLEYSSTSDKLRDESSELLRQYLSTIDERALQSVIAVDKLNGETQEIVTSLAIEQERDDLAWQVNQLAAMMKDAEARGVAIVRQGGGPTAQRLAVDAGKQLGRAYGELELKARDRGRKVALMNRTMNTTVSRELAATALQMEDAAGRMRFANLRYQKEADTTNRQMQDLTIPTFALGNRQYQRELDALRLQTQQVFDQASMPYRQQTYFDPLEPIKGLQPEMISPTAVSAPSAFSTIANGLLQGAQGALQFSTVGADGRLKFY